MTLPLFDPPSEFDRSGVARKLAALAKQNIWIGTSSWKYEGWLDQIYTTERYLTRGRFSKSRFESGCLAEFAEVFPIVCGDFSFYQFPSPEYWFKLFAGAPRHLRFALKAPEEVTADVFPRHARYGARAGMRNETFLNADAFTGLFLEPLEPFRERISTVIFEFGARSTPPREFVRHLSEFLAALPANFRYAVEVRNRTYLDAPYLQCLAEHRVAHVLNAWSKMPSLQEQMAVPGVFTTDFTVVRALLREGRMYEQAVEQFAPYREVKDENPEGRAALKALIRRMKEERRAALIFVNNRFEGNAPTTIQAVIEDEPGASEG
ncbi:MAG: DUF72 domain-containing protein [Bryobacteraceae bacterium]